jgi:hypothetical protein
MNGIIKQRCLKNYRSEGLRKYRMLPYELTKWISRQLPDETVLERALHGEGLVTTSITLIAQSRCDATSLEQLSQQSTVLVVVTGKLQVSFPGYGVVALEQGDQLDVESGTRFDLSVLGHQSVKILVANRNN